MNDEVTSRIIGAAFEVMNELGEGFSESVYQSALMLALQQKGLFVEREISLPVFFAISRLDALEQISLSRKPLLSKSSVVLNCFLNIKRSLLIISPPYVAT